MMADTSTVRILTTKVKPPVQGFDRGTRSLHEDVGYLGHERTLSLWIQRFGSSTDCGDLRHMTLPIYLRVSGFGG